MTSGTLGLEVAMRAPPGLGITAHPLPQPTYPAQIHSVVQTLLCNISEAEHPGHPAHSCCPGGRHLEPEESAALLMFGR